MINRRAWQLKGEVGRVEGVSGRVGFWTGTHATARLALPPEPDAFTNYVFVSFTRLRCEHLSDDLGFLLQLLALNLIKVRKTVPFTSATCSPIAPSRS